MKREKNEKCENKSAYKTNDRGTIEIKFCFFHHGKDKKKGGVSSPFNYFCVNFGRFATLKPMVTPTIEPSFRGEQ